MDKETLVSIARTIELMAAQNAAMAAAINALIATHPHPKKLRAAFLQEVERHTAGFLASPLPDETGKVMAEQAKRLLAKIDEAIQDA